MAVASAPGYGGYDYKFAGQVPERFMCTICTKVLREPHLTVCCGQHFCEPCLENWFMKQRQGKKSCPHCREKGFNHFLNKALKREINELKIHCTHQGEEGCHWIGELGNLQTHLNSESGCGYVEVECTNNCKLYGEIRKFQRKALRDHLDNECTRRRYKCKYCGQKAMYKDITGKGYRQTYYHSHYNGCDMYPLDCPNKCGKRQIQRKDMYAHRDKCPEEPVRCQFEAEGCTTRVVRKDFDNHMSTQMLHHMLLMKTKHDHDMQEIKAKHGKDMKKLTRTMGGISMNVDSLLKNCTEDQKLPLQSIRALIDESHHLKEDGHTLTIEIPDLSQYKTSGDVWRSPPFYIKEGYKMCLAVDPSGTGKGKGTHVSLSLVLMKGEFDDELEWPIAYVYTWWEGIKVKVMSKQPQQKTYNYACFQVIRLDRVHDDQVVQSSDTFLKHGTRDGQEMVRGALAEVQIPYLSFQLEYEPLDEPFQPEDD